MTQILTGSFLKYDYISVEIRVIRVIRVLLWQLWTSSFFRHLLWVFLILGISGRIFPADPPGSPMVIHLETAGEPAYPVENLRYQPLKHMRVALVLSGGGARGFAHIGVLKAFEEYQIPIDLIVGTSIGSIVGGFYAAGFSAEEIRRIVQEIDWNSIFVDQAYRNQLFWAQKHIPRRHILQFRFDGLLPAIPASISQGQKIFQTFYNHLLGANFQAADNFDRLRVPFRAVATDLVSGEKVVLGKGDLAEAINASMAFPLLFAPVEIDGKWLVDGGITDNLPVDVAIQQGADMVIAVDATSDLRRREEIGAPWEIADQVTSIMMKNPTEESRLQADLLIQPALEAYKGGDFRMADELIAIGYRSGREIADSLKNLMAVRRDFPRDQDVYIGRASVVQLAGGGAALLPESFSAMCRARYGQTLYRGDIYRDLTALYESGFFENVYARVEGPPEARRITYHLDAFPRVNQVNFRHHGLLPDSLYRAAAAEIAGRPLNINDLFARIDTLRNTLIGAGYSLAAISEIRYQAENGELDVLVDEGFINEVRIVGNDVTRNFVILREFPLKRGDVFRASAASEGIQNIYSTSLFDRVLINLKKNRREYDVIIKVKERKYLLARLGANYSLERRTTGFVELLEDNLLGTDIKLKLFGSAGDFERRAEVQFYTVRLFNTYLTSSLTFFYREQQDRFYRDFIREKDYTTTRRGWKFVVGQQIERLGLISAELRLESIDVSSTDPQFAYQSDLQIRSVAVRSVVDKRDKLPFPDRGIYNRWYWEAGNSQLLGSSVPFTKIFLGLEGYYPLLEVMNYHPYLYVGSADLTLPFAEYFFFGGQNHFAGLHNREKFGRQFIQTGLDWRWEISPGLPVDAYLIGSYAIGASWERPDDRIEGEDFLQSVSASLAINSLLGPIQFTYGNVSGQRRIFYFSLGFDF